MNKILKTNPSFLYSIQFNNDLNSCRTYGQPCNFILCNQKGYRVVVINIVLDLWNWVYYTVSESSRRKLIISRFHEISRNFAKNRLFAYLIFFAYLSCSFYFRSWLEHSFNCIQKLLISMFNNWNACDLNFRDRRHGLDVSSKLNVFFRNRLLYRYCTKVFKRFFKRSRFNLSKCIFKYKNHHQLNYFNKQN